MLHRTRDLLIRQRTQLINALRAHLAEFGLVAETGREGLAQLAEIITDESNREALPSAMKQALQAIVDQLAALELPIGALDRAIHAHHRANDMSCRIETVPGIGVIAATAIASTVTDPSNFKSGRDVAAWIGLVPRQHSTGGKERLGRIPFIPFGLARQHRGYRECREGSPGSDAGSSPRRAPPDGLVRLH